MIFTQKRERVVFSKEERETIYDKLTNYIDIPDMPLDNNDSKHSNQGLNQKEVSSLLKLKH